LIIWTTPPSFPKMPPVVDASGSPTGGCHTEEKPFVVFSCTRAGPQCPFGNCKVEIQLTRGSCLHLKGASGLGKSTLATFVAGLSNQAALRRLGIEPGQCQWREDLPRGERVGALFQQTTLIDTLTVAGNVCAALVSSASSSSANAEERNRRIKELIEAVGLDFARDAGKRPAELSGGMARRASLALQLAQHKRVIVLDEPFTGLDPAVGASVARELLRLRREQGTALLLISHEPDLASLVMGDATLQNMEVTLTPPPSRALGGGGSTHPRPTMFGVRLHERFLWKLTDYLLWSLPLIMLTFVASGLAIAMLSADVLAKIDVTDQVLEIIDKEVRPLLTMVTGEESNPMLLMMVKMKVRGMINTAVPQAKASLYSLGLAKLFVLEIGPLLTALLLCGRIGGSYAGEVATMQATAQNKLLRTLGLNPQRWTLLPAIGGAVLAAPFLTIVGTMLALWLGGVVGSRYGIAGRDQYFRDVRSAVFPTLRLQWWEQVVQDSNSTMVKTLTSFDLRSSFSESSFDGTIELATYPPCYLLLKSVVFILVILGVAESAARLREGLTPQHVSGVITSSVVIAGLLVIFADWGFSQLLLLRH
jgi:ABC-type nitrate/sulfonate/bicarbonate transport system ATPase subunit